MKYDYHNPDKLFRGTDFWMLNDELDADELKRQIGLMHGEGVNSFIARTYIGLRSDYPGEEFMGKMKVILEEASRFGMTVFLQAGYMPEAVLGLPSDCALHTILPKKEADVKPEDVVFCRHGDYAYTDRNTVVFLDMFSKPAVQFYIRQSYETMWERFSAYYGSTVLSIWVDEPSYDAAYLPYTPELGKRFAEKWGCDLAPNIWLLYEDGQNEDGVTARDVRYAYWTIMEELLGKHYFGQIRDWCNQHDLWFSGHLMEEQTLRSQISRACATMPYYRYFDIPGIDYLTAEENWRFDEIKSPSGIADRRYNLYNTPLQCTSAAHQAGKEHILCEMYGVSTQNMGFRDQRNMFDHFASLGINHRSVHGMFYSLHGRGKRAYPPHVNYYQPYFGKYKNVTDYVARTSAFLSNGAPVRDILLLHPLETAYTLYRGSIAGVKPAGSAELNALDEHFFDVHMAMTAAQLPFEFGDEMSIRDFGEVRTDGFGVGRMTYRTVVVPYCEYLRRSTLDLLEAYRKKGGQVLFVGCLPTHIDGRPETVGGFEVVPDADALMELLTAQPRAFALACDGDTTKLHVNHRRADGTDYLMVFNSDCREAKRCALTFDGKKEAVLFFAADGTEAPLPGAYRDGKTTFSVTVYDGSSVLLTVKDAASVPAAVLPEYVTTSYPLGGSYRFERSHDNVLLLEFCHYRLNAEDAMSEQDYPVLAIQAQLIEKEYNGDIWQEFRFESALAGIPLKLALEDPEKQEIRFNSVPVDHDAKGAYYFAKQFKVVTLPDALVKGTNVISIRRHFEPLRKATNHITSLFQNLGGVELESMYLLGSFAVSSRREHTNNDILRYNRRFTLTAEPDEITSELTSAGYPFYTGTVTFEKTFTLPAALEGRELTLELEGFHGCTAEIFINGVSCGDMNWFPYTVDVTKAVKSGENRLEVRIMNTLRSLLGPYHRPTGEIGAVWGGYSNPNKPWVGYSPENPKWYEHRDRDTGIWTDDYNVLPLGFGSAVLSAKERLS